MLNHLQFPSVRVNDRNRQMISHIEKVSRGDEALSDEFQGSFCIVRSGSIYHKRRVAFRITCEPKTIVSVSRLAIGCLQRGCLMLRALWPEPPRPRH